MSRALTISLENKGEVDASFKLYSVAADLIATASHKYASKIRYSTSSSLHDSEYSQQPTAQAPQEEDRQLFLFTPKSGSIPRKGSLKVKVEFTAMSCGQLNSTIICEVADGLAPTQYALAKACVVFPEIDVTPCEIDLGIIFKSKQIETKVTMCNKSCLANSFVWTKYQGKNKSSLIVKIAPQKGKLDPYGRMEIAFSLLPTMTGKMESIALCKVPGMDYPVTVTIKCYCSDLRCSYHVLRPLMPQVADIIEKIRGNTKGQSQCGDYSKGTFLNYLEFYTPYQEYSENLIDTSNLPTMDYGKHVPVGSVQWQRLVIRNLTSIPSKVQVAATKYDCMPQLKAKMLKDSFVPEDLFSSLVVSKEGVHQKSAFLLNYSNEIDLKYWCHLAHTKIAQKFCKVIHEVLLETGQSIAVAVFPKGECFLEAWGEWQCDVLCFSCMPGSYSDTITCLVGSLPKAEIPLTIRIIGTPLIVRHNRLEPLDFFQGADGQSLVLKWTALPAGHPPETRSFWVTNISPSTMEVEWIAMKLQKDARDYAIYLLLNVHDEAFVHVALVGDGDKGPVKLLFEVEDKSRVCVKFKEHLQVDTDESPFCVAPMNQVIPGHTIRPFSVTFSPPEVSKFSRILYGRTKHLQDSQTQCILSSNTTLTAEEPPQTECLHESYWERQTVNVQGLPIGSASLGRAAFSCKENNITALVVCMEASVFAPRLQTNAEDGLEFLCHGSDPLSHPSYSRALLLKNAYSFSLPISVSTSPVFYVIAAKMGIIESEDKAISQHLEKSDSLTEFFLPPGWTLQLDIRFFPESEDLSSCQDSSFDDQLLINILEQYQQVVNLHARLVFPNLTVISESIWFGRVLTTASQTLQFSIINNSLPRAEWVLIKDQLQQEIQTSLTQQSPEELPKEETNGSKKSPASEKKLSATMKEKKPMKEKTGMISDQPTEKPIKSAVSQSPSAASLERKRSTTATADQTAAPESLRSGEEAEDPFKVWPERGAVAGSGWREGARQMINVTFVPAAPILYRQKLFINVGRGRGRGCCVTVAGQGIHPHTPQHNAAAAAEDKAQKQQQQQQLKSA